MEHSEEGQTQQGVMDYVPPRAYQSGGPSSMAFHHHHQQLQLLWATQMQEIGQTTDFKNHTVPLAQIKKIMKADEDVCMISAEAPVIFAKACEMFILELALRSWTHTEENKRRTLQKNDIGTAISRTDVFDFLVDIISKDNLKEEGLGVTKLTCQRWWILRHTITCSSRSSKG